jgi:cell division protein YceG involved in septum cleavage
MRGAANPAKGSWLYYVNGDANGDLVFLNTDAEFERAALKCYQHHWGCAKP